MGMTEAKIVQQLADQDRCRADEAVAIILHKGECMIESLLKQCGNKVYFRGVSLLNPRAAMLLPMPKPGDPLPENERYRVITVEAAALYLVSAIRHGGLNFSQSPLLFDRSEPRGQRLVANTPERMARAYDAATKWYQRHVRGLDAEDRSDPIATSGLAWY